MDAMGEKHLPKVDLTVQRLNNDLQSQGQYLTTMPH